MTSESLAQPRIPTPVRELADSLAHHGHGTWVVGEAAHDLAIDRVPTRFGLATSAAPDELIELFPTAVPTAVAGRCWLVPTGAGPVDLLPLPPGASLEHTLAGRELTLLALAFSLTDDQWIDPHGAAADLRQRRLRVLADPKTGPLGDPRCALRVIRLSTCDGYGLDPDLRAALCELAPRCAVSRSPHGPRRELNRILLAPDVARGLELLRATGLEAAIAPKVDADASALVAAQPPVLVLRLLAWLRGASAGRVMRRLRYPLNVSRRVLHLLQSYPLEHNATAQKRASLQRLARRLDQTERTALAELRELELDALAARGRITEAEAEASRAELRALMQAVVRLEEEERAAHEAAPLALDGRDVMRILGAEPGREVGTALRRLRERVAADPSLNTADGLKTLLLRWREERGDDVAGRADDRDIAPEPSAS
jgi:tRNA nucleotidyltransferase/poly(A) polymerase